ncbi:MAG: C4-type zinc ribbon domain-containing protein [Spirochaetota bacterium]|jgi:predicted  nucleic acid-binding Zn-ribbon protein|nr:C4-type zinc ribbon domain-containing protein [Spirochaetota bacterium]
METVHDIVEKLVALQSVLKESYDLEQMNKNLPLSVYEMRKRIEPLKQEIEGMTRDAAGIRARSGAAEIELQTQEDRLQEINRRMSAVSKSREFEAIEAEQSAAHGHIEALRSEQISSKTRLENLSKKLTESEAEYKGQEERILAEEARVQTEINKNAGRMQELSLVYKEKVVGIDQSTLAKFERILKSKNGIGIVPVVQESCDGCHMKIPPQLLGKVRRAQELVTCLNCSRFLYVDDDA